MSILLVCNCCGDEKRAPISLYLMKNKLDQVLEGVKRKAGDLDTNDILFLLPEGEKITGLEDSQVVFGEESLVTSNPFAVIEILNGNLPRPYTGDEKPIYDGRELVVISTEEAYAYGSEVKVVYIIKGSNIEVKEVELGTKVSKLVDIDGIKGVLLGGIRGKFVAVNKLEDYEVSKDSLYDSITLFDKTNCMVDEMVKIMEESQKASCGKCVLCREGTLQYKLILQDMVSGKGKIGDLELVNETGELIQVGAYCNFGKSMPGPLLSALELFGNEFEEHIKKKSCSAGVCYQSSTYIILPKQCIGCGECVDSCDEDAIEGKKGFIHMIDEALCEACGKCVSACEEGAIIKLSGPKPPLPKKLTKVGKF